MPKRMKQTSSSVANENASIYNVTAQLFEDSAKLQQIKNACGYLTRIEKPGAKHVQKFIDRVFGIVGVQQEKKTARPAIVRKRATRRRPVQEQASAVGASGD